jgi:hypothetical protein
MEPYTQKTIGVRQSMEFDNDGEAAAYCAKMMERDGMREVNAFTMSGRLICNLCKSAKIKIDEKK